MLIDITPNLELPEHKLVLHKLDTTPLQELKNIYNIVHTPFYAGIDELNFSVSKTRFDYNGNLVENEIYPMIEGDFLIQLDDQKFFIITSVIEKDDGDGTVYKEVECLSREYELGSKKLVDYKGVSRKLYSVVNEFTDDGLELGVLNYIFNNITKGWTIGNYDSNVLLKYRTVEFSSNSLLDVFKELQITFNCLLTFDTVARTINIEDFPDTVGQNTGLIISDANFIEQISKTINSDEIKTRLFLYGADNISVHSANPTGQPYIDDLSFYRTTKYMSDDLLSSLTSYDAATAALQSDLNIQLNARQDLTRILENCLNSVTPILENGVEISYAGSVQMKADLTLKQNAIDLKIEERALKQERIRTLDNGESLADALQVAQEELLTIQTALASLIDQKNDIVMEITSLEDYVSTIDNQIILIEQAIESIHSQVALSNYFTPELLAELDRFIKVETYNDSSYTQYNIPEFLAEGRKILSRISSPAIQFDLEVVDFLQLVEAEHFKKKFKLGDAVNLIHEGLGFDQAVRLVAYSHDVDAHKLTLTFSNKYSVDDPTLYLRDLMQQSNATASSIDFNKFKWTKASNMESFITSYVDSKLEESRQNILTAVGQKYLFDDSGLWLYKEVDGIIDDHQVRAVNNEIVFTKDNWNTVSTAIGPNGVYAEAVYGTLGAFAELYADQLSVGVDGSRRVPDNALSDIVMKETTLYNGTIINKTDGIVVTAQDEITHKVWAKTTLNATEGFKIQTRGVNEIQLTDALTIDINGNIVLNKGSISWAEDGVPGVNKPYIPPGYEDSDVQAYINSTYIDANGVWTNQVHANNIITTNAKITAAQIENLVVGSNVTMGANATINWNNVEGGPQAVTNITNNTVTTSYVNALNVTAADVNVNKLSAISSNLGSIQAGSISSVDISGGTIVGSVIKTGTTGTRITLNEYNSNDLRIYDGGGSVGFIMDYDTGGAGTVAEASNRIFLRSTNAHALKIESQNANMSIEATGGKSIYVMGKINFAGATVAALTAQFG